jgi:shikimate kinase
MKKVYLVGIMGSGKSFWGKLLAQEMELPFVDLDEYIAHEEGKTVPALFEEYGEAHFRHLEAAAIRNPKLSLPTVMACGGGTPCFNDNMAYMLGTGVVVWLNPNIAEVVDRIWKARLKRPLIANAESKEEVTAIIHSIVEKRKQWYGMAHITLTDTTIDLPALKEMIEAFSNNI